MLLGQGHSEITSKPEPPFGLRASAVMLIAFGCFLGLYVLVFVVLFVVSIVRASRVQEHSDIASSFLAFIVAASLTYLCFRAAAALRRSKRWAAYVAMGFGVLLLWLAGIFIYDWSHPERQGPDEYFGVFIVPFFLVAGLWWCIYLNLPHVRAMMKDFDPKD
jgi:heme/copper-type cytochrome/quinol oxidase subunit 4